MAEKKGGNIMAIYHFSAQIISRGKGQSAVAAASYRSGDKLVDERTGEIKNYHREVKPEGMILAPKNAPDWVYDRQKLWNEVERVEKRKNSQLAREINIALPKELSNDQQKELVTNYIKEQFVDKGMIADVCIHRDDSNNPHAHVMLTTREISPEGFTVKNRDWNNRELINTWREGWANSVNYALEREGIQEKVSHLSHEKRGLDYLPTVHLGHVVNAMEKRGVRTEKGDHNRDVVAYNELKKSIGQLEKDRTQLQRQFAKEVNSDKFNQSFTEEERKWITEATKYLKAKFSLSLVDKRLEQLEAWAKRIQNNKQFMQWKSETIEQAKHSYSSIDYWEKQIEIREKALSNIRWMNPLKYKENKLQAENLEKQIQSMKESIKSEQSKLEYPKSKLNFDTYEQLQEIEKTFKIEVEKANNQNRSAIRSNAQEREVLQNARNAYKSAYIRFTAEKYPNMPEMAYIDFQTARNIAKVSQHFGHVDDFAKLNQVTKANIEKANQYVEFFKTKGSSTDKKEVEKLLPQLDQLKQVQSLLDSIIQGMQQAQQRQQREGERERNERTKKKSRSRGLER